MVVDNWHMNKITEAFSTEGDYTITHLEGAIFSRERKYTLVWSKKKVPKSFLD